MPHVTSKPMSKRDPGQTLQSAFNDNDATISTSGFIDGKVGHRIKVTAISATMDESRYFDEINTEICTFTNGSPIVIVPNTTNFVVGQYVLLDIGNAGIPDGTTILSLDSSTQITMTNAFTGSTGAQTGHFANLLKRIRVLYNNANHDILLDATRVE